MLINTLPCNEYSDQESEAQVLESLFISPELIYQTDISTNDFTNTAYRGIYIAMLRLHSDGIALNDIVAISQSSPNIDPAIVSELATEAFISSNINYHCKILKQKTFNRRAKELVNSLQSKLGDDDFLQELELAATTLQESQTTKHTSIPECIANLQASIEEAKQRDYYGIQTGFYKLNDCILGLCPQHLIMLGGFTSQGKSTLLSQMVADICRNKAKVIIFTVEDSIRDKMIKLISTITGETSRSIVRGYADSRRLQKAYDEIKSWDLNIYDGIHTLEEMDLKIKKHKLQGGVDVVAIDYVQNLQVRGESIYDRMSHVSVKLQEMKQKHNVNIIALSQISEGDKLRGAQELESAADIVLFINRDKEANIKGDKNFDLVIRKNRPFQKLGKISCQFSTTWTGIEEKIEEKEKERERQGGDV